jgi:hypothetical protein
MDKAIKSDRQYHKRSSDTELSNYTEMTYAKAVNNSTQHSSTILAQPGINRGQRSITSNSQNTSDETRVVRLQLLELKTTQQELDKHQITFEAKQERSNSHMLEEIKRTNDNINNNVMATIGIKTMISPIFKKKCSHCKIYIRM